MFKVRHFALVGAVIQLIFALGYLLIALLVRDFKISFAVVFSIISSLVVFGYFISEDIKLTRRKELEKFFEE
jgi:hypothetical protein